MCVCWISLSVSKERSSYVFKKEATNFSKSEWHSNAVIWEGLLGATSRWIKVKRDRTGDMFLFQDGTEINSHKYSGTITGAVFFFLSSSFWKIRNMPPWLLAVFAKCPTRAHVFLSGIYSPSCLTVVTVKQDWYFIYIPLRTAEITTLQSRVWNS